MLMRVAGLNQGAADIAGHGILPVELSRNETIADTHSDAGIGTLVYPRRLIPKIVPASRLHLSCSSASIPRSPSSPGIILT